MTFAERISSVTDQPLTARGIDCLQVNMGARCNMSCLHCHVSSGPGRIEMMELQTVDAVLGALEGGGIPTLDITGGAPELNPHFRYLVEGARKLDLHVMVRTNLTVFFVEDMEGLPGFFRENRVEVIASLPGLVEEEVDRVRGRGAFRKSIEGLKMLNEVGYGRRPGELVLDLIYNPEGPQLPRSQEVLEKEFAQILAEAYGITFTNLFVLINMPVGRFRESLARTQAYEGYMKRLAEHFNPATLDGLMCRTLVSVGWDGRLYDCDFNQMMGLPIRRGYPRHIGEFDGSLLARREIALGDHCYGCTAVQGSS